MIDSFAALRRVGAWAMVSAVLATGLVMSARLAEAQSVQQRKPNVVFILVDNVGWGSFGVYGGTTPTPRINQLANEGIRLSFAGSSWAPSPMLFRPERFWLIPG